MYKWRRSTLPPLPPSPDCLESYADIINSENYQEWKNFHGGVFTVSPIINEEGSTSIIFIDEQFARKIITQNDSLYLDATYKIVPRVTDALQFLTLIMVKYNHVR